MAHFVVVGAGQAASALVAKLRSRGFDGRVTVIGEEPALPYRRPALSKTYLMGQLTLDRILLRPESFFADNDIAVRLGEPVTHLDAGAGTISVGGETIAYDGLALTTGSIPRNLPASIGGALPGVYCIRTLADADAIAPEFQSGRRVLIVGGGYIGLEAAAVAAQKGLQVTLVEMSDRILARVAAPQTSRYFRDLHRSHGVSVLEGIGVERLTGADHVTGALLSDGSAIQADFVIVGVGVMPATSLAQTAGIVCDNGIIVDEHGRTSAAKVWAAGDCANFPWRGRRIRLESVQNANDQAEIVAADMMGLGADYNPTPWFWSDQFDTKLQIAGLHSGYDRVATRQIDQKIMSVWYFAGEKFLAVDAMNDPQAYMVGKQLLQNGRSPDAGKITDSTINLKSLLT